MKHFLKFLVLAALLSIWACNDKDKSQVNAQKQNAQETVSERHDLNKVEPPHWWTGFKNKELQLLVYHPKINEATVSVDHPDVVLKKVHQADSPNYLFLDLQLPEGTTSGFFNINFEMPNGTVLVESYELKARTQPAEEFVGFTSADAIYLITPDRFANAKPSNDSIPGMKEQGVDRSDDYARHGGDIVGITNHLDYIGNLGFTAVWPSPLLTNDMNAGSYHGYAITNFYEVDPRFGTISEYEDLANGLQSKGMKLIMDQVANHCGLGHWWMQDLPFKNWVNFQEHYLNNQLEWDNSKVITSNHARTTNQDIYASEHDKKLMTNGWFVATMPDLNQDNPFMANYLIQNSIWWIERLQLGGIRQDTYPYPDKAFMSDWAGAIMNEYPNFNIVGEEWSTNPLLIAYWQEGHNNHDGYKSNLPSTMDFAMQEAIVSGLKNEETWGTGLKEIYVALSNDFSYANPQNIMAFPDNHDMSRIFTQLDGDITKTKMALSYLAILPRIFQMYYGTEILMNDFEKPGDHGLIRTDFPGGWAGDQMNAFMKEGLDDSALDMQKFVTKLLNYRKNSKAIHEGKTIHFAPKDGVYVLVRQHEDETVIHILNKNETPYQLDLSRFEELQLEGTPLMEVFSEQKTVWSDTLEFKNPGTYLYTTKF